MMLLKMKNRRGVTLVELLIVLGLLSLITSMMFSFFFQGTRVYSMGELKSAATQDTSIAAFMITNAIRNVKDISLTNMPGYTSLDIQNKYPNINLIEYTIMEENDKFSLAFTLTHDEGYSVESKVLLNNVKSANTGLTSSEIWYLATDEISETPAIIIGSSTGAIVEGIGGTAVYSVSTANIENGESLVIGLDGSPFGLSINITNVNNDLATLSIMGNSAVTSGIYTFSINYTGASECIGTLFVGQNVPVINLNGNSMMTINRGSTFVEPGYSAVDSNGSDITGSVVIAGDTVNTSSLGTYDITYNVTNLAGVPAVEVVRTVIVQESGSLPDISSIMNGITSLVVNNPASANPTISVPGPRDGVSFKFTSVTPSNGNPKLNIEPGQILVTVYRHNNKDDEGTIELTPYFEGAPKTPRKIFNFSIKKNGEITIP